jgi:Predicted metal-dependent hydrolase with the TIM-barrel fold
MTKFVVSVLGEVDPSTIGAVLPHEHLFCDFSVVTGSLDHVLNDVGLAVDELAPLQETGVTCIVDVSPPDLGRSPQKLRSVAESTGITVVMGTGWYRSPFYPPHLEHTSAAELAAGMVEELTVGVLVDDGKRVRAGIIGEIGAHGSFVNPTEERVLRAAGRASKETGAPLTTHAAMHPVGIAQLDILDEEGVDPSRVVIGHADTYLDLDYHREVLRRGAFLQFDTCGRVHLNPDDRRADMIVRHVRDGWLDRLLLSSDRCYRSDLLAFGGVGYAWTVTGFSDMLRARGLSNEELDVLTRVNPLRMLAW